MQKEAFTATRLLVLATPCITQHTPSEPASKIKHDYVIMPRVLLVSFNIFVPAPAITHTGHRGAVVKSGPQRKRRGQVYQIKLYKKGGEVKGVELFLAIHKQYSYH